MVFYSICNTYKKFLLYKKTICPAQLPQPQLDPAISHTHVTYTQQLLHTVTQTSNSQHATQRQPQPTVTTSRTIYILLIHPPRQGQVLYFFRKTANYLCVVFHFQADVTATPKYWQVSSHIILVDSPVGGMLERPETLRTTEDQVLLSTTKLDIREYITWYAWQNLAVFG